MLIRVFLFFYYVSSYYYFTLHTYIDLGLRLNLYKYSLVNTMTNPMLQLPIIILIFFSEDMITDMMKPDFRNYIKDITCDKYGIDLEQAKTQSMHPVSSFRKLNID